MCANIQMSLSRDGSLFGIALILYGIYLEISGFMSSLYPMVGLLVVALAFLGSVVSVLHSIKADDHSASEV